MKKKFILLAMMLLTIMGGVKFNVLNAQETITIGEGSVSEAFASPSNTNYRYTFSQQIYLSDEFQGKYGKITSYAFKCGKNFTSYGGNPITVTRHFKIYMINTDKSTFDGMDDWASVQEENLVFDGDVTFGAKDTWTVVELNTPFSYEGSKNLLICINDNTGSYENSVMSYYSESTTEARTIYAYRDGDVAYDATSIDFIAYAVPQSYITQAQFTFEAVDDGLEPATPGNLQVTVNDHQSISLTWNAAENAQKYNIYQDGVKIGNTNSTSYDVTGLTPNTTYSFTVTSVRGTKESAQSDAVSATTAEAPKPRNIVFTLMDSASDGWQNNYLTVVADDGTNETLKHSNGSTNTYTLEITQGAKVTVSFYAVNYYTQTYSYECSYTIKYQDGDVIYESGQIPNCSAGTVIPFEFTVESNEPSVTINLDPATIALGTVRMLENNGAVSEEISVNLTSTTVTSVTCDNDFFKLIDAPTEATSDDFTFSVGYDETAEITDGTQTGAITITWKDGDPITIDLTATAYTPVKGDVKANAIEVEFNNNSASVTPNFANLKDDYKFQDEAQDGSTPDAVYTFTVTEDFPVVSASIEGNDITNSYLAIEPRTPAGPQGPTTFGPYEFSSNENLNYFEYDNQVWSVSNSKLWGKATADSWIRTKEQYAITQNTILSFDLMKYGGSVVIGISSDGETYTQVGEKNATENNINISLSEHKDKVVYIGFSLKEPGDYGSMIDNLALTDGSNKSRVAGLATIDGVQYPAGTYYLVAAADKAFTVNLSTAVVLDVPQNVTVTSENHIAGGDITLKWDEIEGAKYNVYVGDICHNGETPITATEYTISNVDYSKEGWNITVTAVYEGLGESEKSETVNVKVTGYGHILVNVNGGISNVNYTINGTDEFGNVVEEITGTTDNDGMSTVSVLAGTYTVTVSKFDYKDATMENVVVNYGAQTEAALTMTQKPAASFAVTAVDNVTTANVSWTTDEYTTFNVYRRNVQTDEVEKIASNVYYKQYQDAAWNEFAAGDEYQYGVSAMIENNSGFEEGFEGGAMPEGWSTYTENIETYNWTISNSYYYNNTYYPHNGNYAAFSKTGNTTNGNNYRYYLITPAIDWQNNSKLEFYYLNPYGSYGASWSNTLRIMVKLSSEQNTEWTEVASYKYTQSWTMKELSTELQSYIGENINIAFVTNAYCSNCIAIDDVTVSGSSVEESRVNWASPITKEEWVEFDGTEDNTWSEKNVLVAADHTINGEVTVNKLSINGGILTVAKDAKLTVNGKLNNATSANFVIEDGAQVFQSSADVKATFNMGIINPSEWSEENKEGWNFVSSPFTAAGLSQFTFDLSGKGLDLYRYNGAEEGAEWRHYNVGNAEFASNNFDLGYGYMLAHETKETVSLYGTLNNASEHTWEVSYTENAVNGDLANFHLVGNPFSFDMDMNKLAQTNMVTGYAVLNAEGNAYTYATEGTVKVGDAFFVKTTAAEPTMSYNHFVRATRGEKANSLIITATSNEGNDNVVVNFNGEKEGFNKLQNFNEAIATVYVQNEGKNYGIANFNEDVQEIELCFNANQMGNYTISIEPNGKFQSVTLVDRFTGIETNMLLEDYHFTAMSNVNNNRFIVKLVNGQQTTDNSHFAYVMGEELIIEAEGAVEIIDMMGRVVYSNDAACHVNRINVSAFDNAAYVIRVVNENGVKVQKIIL